MATPALRALRRAHPAAEIALLGAPQNGALLRGVETFDEFIPQPAGGFAAALESVRALRARRFDWAVILPDSHRTALEAFCAGIPRRAGYARDVLRRALITHVLEPPQENGRRAPFSMIERYLRITRLLGCPDAGERLDLAVDAAAERRAADSLAARSIGAEQPILLVTPGASYGASKLWPTRHYASHRAPLRPGAGVGARAPTRRDRHRPRDRHAPEGVPRRTHRSAWQSRRPQGAGGARAPRAHQ